MTSRFSESWPPEGPDRTAYLLPALGFVVVITVALTLVLLVVLRAVPGLGTYFTWRTHFNLEEEVPQWYARTQVDYVGDKAMAAGFLFPLQDALLPELSQEERGRRIFATVGCAGCHGLKGEGGVFAPPVAGRSLLVITGFVRSGPGGMPAFSEAALPNSYLEAIAAYLGTLTPPSREEPTQGAGVPPLKEAEGQGPSPAELGKQRFSTVGCASCHGPQAQGGFGPALAGVDPERVRAQVRSGGAGMPAFSADTLSNEEVEAIAAYLQALPP